MFEKYSTGACKKILLWLSVDATRESEITGEDLSMYPCCSTSEGAFFILEKPRQTQTLPATGHRGPM